MFYAANNTSTCQARSSSASTEPHPHTGKVTPFRPGDPNVPLEEEALAILRAGKPYKTQQIQAAGSSSSSGGRGLVVQDVHAPTAIVWERILDFDHYADMVPKTVESSNYHPEEELQGDDDQDNNNNNNTQKVIIYTQMKVGFPLLKLQFFIRHEYHPALNSLTWTLDYSKTSDLDDSCGYWYVIPHPDKKDWSRVYYSVDVSMFDWVPSFVVNFMSRQALTEATGWVKKFSEQAYVDQQSKKIEEEEVTPEKLQPQEEEETSRKQEPQEPTRRQRRPRWWFGGKQQKPPPSYPEGAIKDDDKDDDTVATTDTTCDFDDESEVSLEGSKTTEATPAVDTNKATDVAPIIGLTRYVLVASVLGLGMYNVHLYFSQ
jgi:hypothetical protein